MSYSVKNDKNKIALTVSNELYYILINNSMIKRVIKNLLELLRVAIALFIFKI